MAQRFKSEQQVKLMRHGVEIVVKVVKYDDYQPWLVEVEYQEAYEGEGRYGKHVVRQGQRVWANESELK